MNELGTQNDFGTQFGTGLVMAHLIEWLKGQPWFPFAAFKAVWLNRITAAVAALVTSGAIVYSISEAGDFAFTGNIYTVGQVIWTAFVQYAIQHFVYKSSIAPPPNPVLTDPAKVNPPEPVVDKNNNP